MTALAVLTSLNASKARIGRSLKKSDSKSSQFPENSKGNVRNVLTGSPVKKGYSSESIEAFRQKAHLHYGKRTEPSGSSSAADRLMSMLKVC